MLVVMSTEAEPIRRRSGLLTRAHRLFEISSLFNAYQVVADGGKRSPVNEFLDGVPRRTILDVGCGTGAWSYLTEETYVGIDYSESFVRGCRRRFADDARKTFLVGDVEHLDVDQHFDLALMMSVLHHLSIQQAHSLLQKLRSVADRVVVMDLLPNPKNPISRLLYHLDRGDHIRTADDQERLLTDGGNWKVEQKSSFASYNRLYHHTLFLLRAWSPKSDHS